VLSKKGSLSRPWRQLVAATLGRWRPPRIHL